MPTHRTPHQHGWQPVKHCSRCAGSNCLQWYAPKNGDTADAGKDVDGVAMTEVLLGRFQW